MDLLDRMTTYVRIADTLSLSETARDLRLSVAAVSRQLASLEAELGVSLVTRSTRKLALTESGVRWREHCARVLAAVETARSDVGAGPEVRGRVVISAPASYAVVHLGPRLDRVVREHPGLSVELRLEDRAVDLIADGVDIAVRAGLPPPDSSGIVARRLMSFRRVLVASPSYLRERGTPKHPRDLEQHELLGQTRMASAFTRWTFERDTETLEIPVAMRRTSTSPLMLLEWAKAGAGIALVPSWLAGNLRVVMRGWRTPVITVHAIHRLEVRGAPRIATVLAALTPDGTDSTDE
jgi:DNA-binding transcriptional LysR family regulator